MAPAAEVAVVVLLAMAPVGEVRLSIPWAVLHYGWGWAEAVVWSLAGNLAVVPLLWYLLPRFERLLRRSDWWSRHLDRLYARTRKRASKRVEQMQEAALAMVIALPAPGTGAWTAALVAHLFGLPWRPSWRYFYAGITVACFLTVGLVHAGLLAL